jgi:hypothetical protein
MVIETDWLIWASCMGEREEVPVQEEEEEEEERERERGEGM